MARPGLDGVLFSMLHELGNALGAERMTQAAGQVLKTAVQTKAAVDDNVASVLGLPSRAEVEDLKRQLDAVQASLANVSRKLDRLLEDAARGEAPRTATARRRRPPGRHGGDPPAG
ncbi:MAG: hypothetical protein ABR538_13680 [Candidatus Binatia bacterium]